MIQKLRWKFVTITMAIVTLLLFIIFFSLYYSAKMNFYRNSMSTLRSAFMESYRSTQSPPPHRRESPLLVVDKAADGSTVILKNRLLGTENSDAGELIAMADKSGISPGTLKDRNLRYLFAEKEPKNTVRYVFTDIYEEQNALHWQILHSLFIGLASFAAFFLFSILLSKWITKPVEEAWERQRQFTADASHELKTPLTVILSNARMLACPSGNPGLQNKRRAEHIQAEAMRMKQLVENLLLLAENDSEKTLAAHVPASLDHIVSSSVMTWEPVAYEMGKQITLHTETSILVEGDEKKLRQLVDILLDNACKYGKENSPIEVILSRTGTKEARLSVISEGAPLSKEEREHIFLRFYRSDSSRSGVPGYGLGLSIAESIAAEHGGRIEVISNPVNHNCFTVTLPI